jgi:pyruvate/2-oxoglutarate/acetoin dehydrogenase E1 component
VRQLTSVEAAQEALDQLMAESKSYIVLGEGAHDPKACFGTTAGLKEKYPDQIFDTPVSENGMTGVCIGLALNGFRPIHIHMRQDFLLYAMDQIVNNAAKWHSMFGGHKSVPMVIKAFTGKGWGAGHQHSQNLESIFAHIPGLKVVVPSSPRTAKGLMIAAAKDNNPVIFLEPRWIHHLVGDVPEDMYSTRIGRAEVIREGTDITVITWGAMVSEAIRAADLVGDKKVEIVDVLTLSPLDFETIDESVFKTGRAVIVSESWGHCGIASQISEKLLSMGFSYNRIRKVTLPDFYPSSTPALTKDYYPSWTKIFQALTGREVEDDVIHHDIPDKSFTGPF